MNNDDSTSLTALVGVFLAAWISWSLNHSVIWAIIHGLFGWLYVIYWALFL